MLLRDPVDRLYSAYNHFRRVQMAHAKRHGNTTRCAKYACMDPTPTDFHIAATTAVGAFHRCLAVHSTTECAYYHVAMVPHRPYLAVGLYDVFLEVWWRYFPRAQLMVIRAEDYYAAPGEDPRGGVCVRQTPAAKRRRVAPLEQPHRLQAGRLQRAHAQRDAGPARGLLPSAPGPSARHAASCSLRRSSRSGPGRTGCAQSVVCFVLFAHAQNAKNVQRVAGAKRWCLVPVLAALPSDCCSFFFFVGFNVSSEKDNPSLG